LRSAVEVFAEIWYGLRVATIADDDTMRAQARAVRRVLTREPATPVGVASAGTAGAGA
jgi:hypothetical protein